MNDNRFGQMGGNGMGKPALNITLSDMKAVECESCGGRVFAEGVFLMLVSALLTGTGKEGMMPVPAFYCVKCQTVAEKFLPEDLKSKKLTIV